MSDRRNVVPRDGSGGISGPRVRPRTGGPRRANARAGAAVVVSALNRRHAAVERIARAVAFSLDPAGVAEAACRSLLDVFGALFVTVREATPAGLQVLASASAKPAMADAFLRQHDTLPFDGDHLMSGLHRERAPRVFDDARAIPPAIGRRSLSAGIGMRGVAYVPLWTGDEFQGTISAGFEVPLRDARALDLDTLTVAGEFVAMALANARVYAQLQTLHGDLRETRAQLLHSERLRALGELSAGMAHDFNNILVLIQGHADLIERRVVDPAAIRSARQIARAADDGAAMVRRLQAFSRVKREEPAGPGPLDLNAVAEEAIELTRPRWSKGFGQDRTYQITRQLAPRLPATAGYANELRQGLVNLILNALDAMPRGGHLTIATEHIAATGRVRVRVADTGVGMAEDVRQRCLERFFTTKGEAGSGLGLSNLRDVVEAHGGTIDVESSPGRGTTFTLSLPVRAALPAPGETACPESAAPADGRLKVMVVDDEPDIAGMLQMLLEDEAHEVTSCTSVGEALDRVQRPDAGVDLLITDLMMNGSSGWELAERAKSFRPGLPIVLLTGSVTHVNEDEAREHGVDYVLLKPAGVGALRPLLDRLRQDAG